MRLRWGAWVAAMMLVACADDEGEQSETTTSDGSSDDAVGTVGTSGDSGSGPLADETSGSSDDTGTGSTTDLPEPLPPLDAAPLTTEETIVPTHAIDEDPLLDVRVPDERMQLLDMGYGEYDLAEGEPLIDVTPDGSDPPAPGANAAMLTRFVHLADAQLADDESPLRVAGLDNPVISGAFRPQEAHGCRVLNAAVRTINALHTSTPVDFVVLGGDNADAAQTNEVAWFLGILDGAGAVHCDSGLDDDPVAGEDNDPKDRFAPVGLDVPWIWVTGNHDVLVQGNFVIEGREETALGEEVPNGGSTRDWASPGGPVFMGPVVADPERALLDGPALMDLVASSGDGHGITRDVAASGRATYAWDVADSDVRFVVVDTASPTGGAEGLVTQGEVDDVIRPLLDQAEADGKLVLVATHHASTSLGDGGGLGGMVHPDALTTADWQALLGEYTNVLAHLCGHSHVHRALLVEPMGGTAYWEVITSALADWPHQMRMLEVHDQDNGFVTITGIGIDYATGDDDPLADEGRALGIVDLTAGWTDGGAGELDDRNVRLWIPVP